MKVSLKYWLFSLFKCIFLILFSSKHNFFENQKSKVEKNAIIIILKKWHMITWFPRLCCQRKGNQWKYPRFFPKKLLTFWRNITNFLFIFYFLLRGSSCMCLRNFIGHNRLIANIWLVPTDYFILFYFNFMFLSFEGLLLTNVPYFVQISTIFPNVWNLIQDHIHLFVDILIRT